MSQCHDMTRDLDLLKYDSIRPKGDYSTLAPSFKAWPCGTHEHDIGNGVKILRGLARV